VLLSRPFLGLETKTETLDFRSRDRDLDKMNSSALQSRDYGLEITTLGSVSTRLRCDGIFNDQFITQSLQSQKVKKF